MVSGDYRRVPWARHEHTVRDQQNVCCIGPLNQVSRTPHKQHNHQPCFLYKPNLHTMPLANIPRLKNPNICHLLRCTPDELRQLKNALKSELQAQWVGGRPFLGQLPSESDPDGSIREGLWAAVATKNPLLGRLLNGRRYPLGTLPAGFADGLRMVKDKIFADINTAVRRAPQIRPRKRRRSPSPAESSSYS